MPPSFLVCRSSRVARGGPLKLASGSLCFASSVLGSLYFCGMEMFRCLLSFPCPRPEVYIYSGSPVSLVGERFRNQNIRVGLLVAGARTVSLCVVFTCCACMQFYTDTITCILYAHTVLHVSHCTCGSVAELSASCCIQLASSLSYQRVGSAVGLCLLLSQVGTQTLGFCPALQKASRFSAGRAP